MCNDVDATGRLSAAIFRPLHRTRPVYKRFREQHGIEGLKVFFRYALKANWITEDPSANLSKIEVLDPGAQPYTEEERGGILAQIEPTFPKIHRMVLAFVLVLKFAAPSYQ
jgi:site-specific recombinase XerD